MTNRMLASSVVLAALLYAYALVGETGALLAAAAVFVFVAMTICVRARQHNGGGFRLNVRWLRRRQPGVSRLHRLDFAISQAIQSGRRYDHLLRPRLFDLTAALVTQRHTGRSAEGKAVRDFLGDGLWPLVDPSVKSFNETPTVTARELETLVSKIEELL
jgi:hypothetical protein